MTLFTPEPETPKQDPAVVAGSVVGVILAIIIWACVAILSVCLGEIVYNNLPQPFALPEWVVRVCVAVAVMFFVFRGAQKS